MVRGRPSQAPREATVNYNSHVDRRGVGPRYRLSPHTPAFPPGPLRLLLPFQAVLEHMGLSSILQDGNVDYRL